MAYVIGREHFIQFFAGSSTILGLTLSDFSILEFTNDNQPVDSATESTLSLTELGGGYYCFTYIPSIVGHFYLVAYNLSLDLRIQDDVEIDDLTSNGGNNGTSTVIELTQNYGGTNSLKVNLLEAYLYTLYIFTSQDWQLGMINPMYALAWTELDPVGNWMKSPLYLTPGIYHLVAISARETHIIKAYFEL